MIGSRPKYVLSVINCLSLKRLSNLIEQPPAQGKGPGNEVGNMSHVYWVVVAPRSMNMRAISTNSSTIHVKEAKKFRTNGYRTIVPGVKYSNKHK